MNLITPYGTTDEIINKVSTYYGVFPDYVINNDRKRINSDCRHIVFHILHNAAGMSKYRISKTLDKDYSNVYRGIKKIDGLLSFDKPFRSSYKRIINQVIN